jgi:hypothetical protein
MYGPLVIGFRRPRPIGSRLHFRIAPGYGVAQQPGVTIRAATLEEWLQTYRELHGQEPSEAELSYARGGSYFYEVSTD